MGKLPDAVSLDGPAAGLQFKIESKSGELHYACDLVVKKWIIPPSDYANYKEVIEKFEELAGASWLSPRRTGGCPCSRDRAEERRSDEATERRRACASAALLVLCLLGPGWAYAQSAAPATPDAVIELWEQDWTQNADGATVYHEKKHVRLNNERAYHEFADPRITYNVDTDRLEILVARTKLPDGTYSRTAAVRACRGVAGRVGRLAGVCQLAAAFAGDERD